MIVVMLLFIIILSYDRCVTILYDTWMNGNPKIALIFGLYLYLFPGGFMVALTNAIRKTPRKNFRKYGYFFIGLFGATLWSVFIITLTGISGWFISRIFITVHLGFFLCFFVLGSIVELIRENKDSINPS